MGSADKYFKSENDEALSEEILEFAREYQAKDFSNPTRKNCFSDEELSNAAHGGKLPEDDLREHLLSCSPCFNAFQTARQSAVAAQGTKTNQAVTRRSPWFSFFLRPVAAGALLLLFLCVTVVYVYFLPLNTEVARQNSENFSNGTNKQITVNQNTSSISSAVENSDSTYVSNQTATIKTESSTKRNNQITTKENKNVKSDSENESKLLARNTVNLDQARAAILRNETSSETIYKLPSERVTLNVKLLAGSPAGNYQVSLLDESGEPLIKSLTKKSSGKNLNINLNLRNKNGRARLCIAPTGEVPDCFVVSIGHIK